MPPILRKIRAISVSRTARVFVDGGASIGISVMFGLSSLPDGYRFRGSSPHGEPAIGSRAKFEEGGPDVLPDRYSAGFFYARHLDLLDRIRVHVTSRAILLWSQPCRPHGRLYIGVSLAEPLFVEVEFWLHRRHSSHIQCRGESPRV